MISTLTRELINTSSLDRRSKKVLFDRLSGKTLEDIGQRIGVTRERTRQITNTAIASQDLAVAREEIDAEMERVCGRDENSAGRVKKRAALKHYGTRKNLVKAMEKTFNRDAVISLLTEANPDLHLEPLDDVEICAYIHEEYNIKRYGSYLRCPSCDSIKVSTEFLPSAVKRTSYTQYCRKCNTKRASYNYHNNPNVKQYFIDLQRDNPNRSSIYQIRHYYKRIGKPEMMPKLPRRGIPDSKISVPRSHLIGWGKRWSMLSEEQKKAQISKMNQARAAKRKMR